VIEKELKAFLQALVLNNKGKELILIDPRKFALTRHATHMLQFKPGSDVALLNAMLHTIIEEGLTDDQYIQGYTENFEALKENITDFPPEKMADVCGIDADTIRTVARKYANAERSIIFWGMGISQHVHGTDNARCLIALATVTGQIGRPGTGLHPLRGQNNVQGASDAGLIPMVYPDYQSVEADEVRKIYEDLWGKELDAQRGLTVVEIMDAIHDGEIKGMYIMGENPAMSDPDAGHAREGFAKLEHLVVQDLFLTETAMFADVVLRLTAPGGILPGARVAVFGRDDERPMALNLIESIPDDKCLDLIGRVDLLTAFACLKRSAFYIGNDSGLMHLAAASGIPTLGLFGPSLDEVYAPWGSCTAVARTPLPFDEIFPNSFFNRSISAPRRPIITPGRAV